MESQVDEPLKQAYAEIAKVKFALDGTKTYPDATFTLRLAYGTVKGYEEDGKKIPYRTTFEGLFERSAKHKNKEPFDLPERWVKAKDRLNLKTPLNFISTNDIIGGNSGSPVVNRAGEFVGIIFDGNLQSLVWRFVFDEVDEPRSTSVDACRALSRQLDAGVRGRDRVVKEITGRNKRVSRKGTQGRKGRGERGFSLSCFAALYALCENQFFGGDHVAPLLCVVTALVGSIADAAAPPPAKKKIVLIAGKKSHGPVGNGIHDYGWSVKLLKVMLEHSNIIGPRRVEYHTRRLAARSGTLDDADSIIIISDGRDGDQYEEARYLASPERVRGCSTAS